MKKSELAASAEISGYTMAKFNKDEPASLEVMMKICQTFHCDIGNVMEMIED